jgi:hypothetical protein
VTCFSNSSSFLTMLAPGAMIDAAGISMGGTSQATPHVSGAVAIAKGQNNLLSVDEVISRLTSTGVPVLDTRNIPNQGWTFTIFLISPIIGQASTFSFIGAEEDKTLISGKHNKRWGEALAWRGSSAGWLILGLSATGAGEVVEHRHNWFDLRYI